MQLSFDVLDLGPGLLNFLAGLSYGLVILIELLTNGVLFALAFDSFSLVGFNTVQDFHSNLLYAFHFTFALLNHYLELFYRILSLFLLLLVLFQSLFHSSNQHLLFLDLFL